MYVIKNLCQIEVQNTAIKVVQKHVEDNRSNYNYKRHQIERDHKAKNENSSADYNILSKQRGPF